MPEVTTSSPSPISSLQAAAVAEESKILTFAKAHYSKLISAGVGYAAAKLGVLGFIWKVL